MMWQLRRAQEELGSQLGRNPTIDEAAEYSGVDPDGFRRELRTGAAVDRREVSIVRGAERRGVARARMRRTAFRVLRLLAGGVASAARR